MSQIQAIDARMILDSCGNPTVEVEVTTGDGVFRASIPQETLPRLPQEPITMRDGDANDFGGLNVLNTVKNIKEQFLFPLIGISVLDQQQIDSTLQEVDGTEKFDKYGVNATLPISIACAEAASANKHCPLWKYIAKLADTKKCTAPVPFASIFCGRGNSKTLLPFRDISLIPLGFTSASEAIKACQDICIELTKTYPALNSVTGFGNFDILKYEKQYNIKTIDQMLEALYTIIKNQNVDGKVFFCIHADGSMYSRKKENEIKYEVVLQSDTRTMSGQDLADYWANLAQNYPLYMLIEPFDPEDLDSYKYFKEKTEGVKVITFGDRMTQSNQKLINQATKTGAIGGCILKMNQNGTLSQIINAFQEAQNNGLKVILSSRRGEVNDQSFAHICVGLSTELAMVGGFNGCDRIDKFNEIVRIEETGEVVFGLQDFVQQ